MDYTYTHACRIRFSSLAGLYIRFSSRNIAVNVADRHRKLTLVYRVVLLASYVQVAIIAIITLEIIFFSQYSTSLLYSVFLISYGLAIPLLGLLIWKFLSWYMLHHNYVVLTYSIGTIVFLINASFTLLYVSNGLINEPSTITPMMDPLIIASNSSDTFISSA